jgi:small-conductance mechanosensitive channel
MPDRVLGFWTELGDLVTDNSSAAGRAVTSLLVVAAGALLAGLLGRLAGHRAADPYRSYYVRKITRAAIWFVAIITLAVLWKPFAGRLGVVLGLMAAGIAFAMQEVIGALAGWVNIVSGGIFRVGDRIQMNGVRGDVIDISPLRTKIMEIGNASDESSWVHGRQFTGRVVAISNKATFTEPVFNYSASFDFLWEEVTVPVPYDVDWHRASRILTDEARRVSAGDDASTAIQRMAQQYPIPVTDVEPRVYTTATDNYIELTARFVVPVRRARLVKDELTRTVVRRLAESGIEIASTTQDVRVRES